MISDKLLHYLIRFIYHRMTLSECNTTKNSLNSDNEKISESSLVSSKTKKVFKPSRKVLKGVPPHIENDVNLKHAMAVLPDNYNFEMPKTIWRIQQSGAKNVVLQFPEGLMMFATVIADILKEWTGAFVMIMGNVTYGACCVDDYTAKEFGADFMVHYGHSCLIPVDQTNSLPCLYVFVNIEFNSTHLLETIKSVFDIKVPLALVSIIQFVSSLQKIAQELKSIGYNVVVPQCHPLSPGEVLGCTSVPVPAGYTIIGLGDGRFHMESIMISNPGVETYLYNPYSKILSHEYYDQAKMKSIRRKEIEKGAKAKRWGIILGTLGRQGSLKVLENIESQFRESKKPYTVFYMSEIFPATLKKYTDIDAWVQIACPRLSIDWGTSFHVPLLTPYEASVALRNAEWHDVTYPMDFYANESKGYWTPNHLPPCPCGFTRQDGCRGPRCKSKTENTTTTVIINTTTAATTTTAITTTITTNTMDTKTNITDASNTNTDTNITDNNTTNANTTNANTTDANTTDANTTDANTTDAKTTDAKTTDAKTTDANTINANTTYITTTT